MIFLKKLLKHSVYTAVTILLFSVAFIGGQIVYQMWESNIVLSPIGPKQEVFYSDAEIRPHFNFSDTQIEKDSSIFTVTGRIQNISDTIWYSVNLHLEYSVEGIKMGTCYKSTRLENIEPEKKYFFSIVCSNLDSGNLPSQFTFRPIFDSGYRPEPNKKVH